MIYYTHGSSDSIDRDLYYVFNEMPIFNDCVRFCKETPSENRNIITINDGVVTNCFKGTIDEVNNGLFYTYQLHQQEYPLLVTRLVERDVLIKSVRVVRCLFSHCSRTQYRDEVKKALNSPSWNYKIKVLQSIDFTQISDFGKNGTREDVLKIFAFQLGQILALFNGSELYTKNDIARQFPFYKFLYRQPNNIKDLMPFVDLFIDKISKFKFNEIDKITYFPEFEKKINLINERYV